MNKQPKNVLSLHRQPMKVLREPRRRHLLRPRAVTIDDRRRSSIKTQKVALSGSWQSIKLSFTQLTQMGKLKNLKKLEKLKPYALWLNLQPKRLLALTSNDRRVKPIRETTFTARSGIENRWPKGKAKAKVRSSYKQHAQKGQTSEILDKIKIFLTK